MQSASKLPASPPAHLSALGRYWERVQGDDRMALLLAQRHGLPDSVARILAARGQTLETVQDFLTPTLRALLPDPSHLLDMDRLVARLATALRHDEQIAIFADYDVDGATSGALLARVLRELGSNPILYVPDRIAEGYGPNADAMLKLVAAGAKVIITVDCGVSAHHALDEAAKAGADVLVIDHHLAHDSLPNATAVVNPNRLDQDSPCKGLCAAGVAFLVLVALLRHLRQSGFFATRPEPDLRNHLDLVALGTMCDVMPLTGLNRAFVQQGLKIMARRDKPGLKHLADIAGVKDKPGAWHLGFLIGPRINAGGRVGEASLGLQILASDDDAATRDMAQRLQDYNLERQAIEQQVQEDAMAMLADGTGLTPHLAIVAGEGWHPGVVGIVASRIKEHTQRPALVIALDGEIGKGSGRSISGLHLGNAILAAKDAGLLIGGGGHGAACGITIAREKLAEVAAFIQDHLSDQLNGAPPEPRTRIDVEIPVAAATLALAQALETLQPFGNANPEPLIVLKQARIKSMSLIGSDKSHLRLVLTDTDGSGSLKAMAFRAVPSGLYEALTGVRDRPIDIAGHLRRDEWGGRDSVQFMVEDFTR